MKVISTNELRSFYDTNQTRKSVLNKDSQTIDFIVIYRFKHPVLGPGDIVDYVAFEVGYTICAHIDSLLHAHLKQCFRCHVLCSFIVASRIYRISKFLFALSPRCTKARLSFRSRIYCYRYFTDGPMSLGIRVGAYEEAVISIWTVVQDIRENLCGCSARRYQKN